MSDGKATAKKAFKLAEAFIIANKGQWNHESWEELIQQAADAGLSAEDDEAKRNLGNLVESGKFFFQQGEERAKQL